MTKVIRDSFTIRTHSREDDNRSLLNGSNLRLSVHRLLSEGKSVNPYLSLILLNGADLETMITSIELLSQFHALSSIRGDDPDILMSCEERERRRSEGAIQSWLCIWVTHQLDVGDQPTASPHILRQRISPQC